MIEKILVPVDGSEHSKKAVEFGCDLAEKYGARLYLLHVLLTGEAKHTLGLGGGTVTVDASKEELEEAGRFVIDAARKIAAERGCGEMEADVRAGPTAQRILESAKENGIDMIVMGSRGLSDIAGLLMGSVSHKVSHLAECACVTIR